MPTYDYKCHKCEHTFEKFHGINYNPKIKCPLCGEEAQKMIGAGIGLIFKGSGFYITDYKKKDNDGNGKKYRPTEDNGKAEKKDEQKTEAKTEAKTDVKTEEKVKEEKVKSEKKE